MSDGFLNLLKPPGMSSHDVVAVVRKIFALKKVGHGGTLDPAAAGVLPLALGRATKFIEYMAATDKEYYAEVLAGVATDSGDLTGEVTERADDAKLPDRDELEKIFQGFVGKIWQRPPLHSAIKIQGRPAYKLAREAKIDRLAPREVEITGIELLTCNENSFRIKVACSKGTYIRSLVRDVGEKLNLPLTLSFLLRTRVGAFTAETARTVEELAAEKENALLRVGDCLGHLPRLELAANRGQAFRNGLGTTIRRNVPKICRVFAGDEFLGIGKFEAGTNQLKPAKVF